MADLTIYNEGTPTQRIEFGSDFSGLKFGPIDEDGEVKVTVVDWHHGHNFYLSHQNIEQVIKHLQDQLKQTK